MFLIFFFFIFFIFLHFFLLRCQKPQKSILQTYAKKSSISASLFFFRSTSTKRRKFDSYADNINRRSDPRNFYFFILLIFFLYFYRVCVFPVFIPKTSPTIARVVCHALFLSLLFFSLQCVITQEMYRVARSTTALAPLSTRLNIKIQKIIYK